jgi:hypothetical protein
MNRQAQGASKGCASLVSRGNNRNACHSLKMKLLRLTLAAVLLLGLTAAAQDQAHLLSPADLVREVVTNELADRVQQRKWLCLIGKREGKQTVLKEQVDTQDGPLYRLLAIDGVPLDPGQRQRDDARIDRLLHDPSQQLTVKQGHDQDEQQIEKLMRLMPGTFLYAYDGVEGSLVRLSFRPDPSYNPPTYEARVAHSMAGAILIDPQQKRLAKFSGRLMDRVEFAYGILGHINSGGTVEIERMQVAPSQWKTARIEIQISGRLVFFKTISKQEHETRWSYKAVPEDLGLEEASHLLAR